MKRKIYSAALLQSYRLNFKNQLSKFIHGNFLTPGDIDTEFTMNGKNVKIVGMNDDKQVVLFESTTNYLFIAEPRDVHPLIPKAIVAKVEEEQSENETEL